MTISVEPKTSDESLGAYLKRIRESKGLSLEDLSQKTRVSLKFLQQIEAGEWDKFPVEAYVRGYLNSISETLGLSMPEVLAAYSKEAGSSYSREFLAAETFSSNDESFAGKKLKQGKGGSKVAILGIVILAVSFFAGVYFLKNSSDAAQPLPEKPQMPAVEEDTSSFEADVPDGAENIPPESLSVAPDTLPSALPDTVKKVSAKGNSATTFIVSSDSREKAVRDSAENANTLSVSLTGKDSAASSWVGIYRSLNDNKVLREGYISSSRSRISYSDGDTLWLVIGNPDAVGQMLINGKRSYVPVRKGYASRFCVAPNGKFTRR